MKAIIIARVSTEEQKEANNSLPAQIHRMKTYCERKDFKIIKKFSFDESAYKDNRGDFDKIVDLVLEQTEKIAVCFDKVDRLSRNIFDKRVSLLYEKALRDEIELHFVSDGQIINSKLSASEKFQFSISLGLAKYYSDAISDSVKRSQEQMLRMGIYPSKPPRGYKRDKTAFDPKEIVVDEYYSKIVQKVFEWYATKAFSMDLLRKKLKDEYRIDWSKGYIDFILKNSFYYGVMKWKGEEFKHKYKPLISKELFDQVQQIKAGFNKKPFKYAGKPYMYRGLIRCAHCGLSVTPEKHKNFVYYHCTQYNGKHGAEWLREEEITKQIGKVFKKIQIPKHVLKDIVEALKATHDSKSEFREKQFKELTTERELYSKRIEKIYMDNVDGRITDSEHDKYRQLFRQQLADIDGRLSMLQDAEDNYYITAKYVLEISSRAYELFKSSEVEERRQLIKLVLSNTRIEGKKVRFEAQKPFNQILDFADRQAWLPR